MISNKENVARDLKIEPKRFHISSEILKFFVCLAKIIDFCECRHFGWPRCAPLSSIRFVVSLCACLRRNAPLMSGSPLYINRATDYVLYIHPGNGQRRVTRLYNSLATDTSGIHSHHIKSPASGWLEDFSADCISLAFGCHGNKTLENLESSHLPCAQNGRFMRHISKNILFTYGLWGNCNPRRNIYARLFHMCVSISLYVF